MSQSATLTPMFSASHQMLVLGIRPFRPTKMPARVIKTALGFHRARGSLTRLQLAGLGDQQWVLGEQDMTVEKRELDDMMQSISNVW